METVWLRKEKGGTSIGPYSWPEDGSAAEVDEVTARGLLAIPEHDFTKVGPPPAEITEADPGGDEDRAHPFTDECDGFHEPGSGECNLQAAGEAGVDSGAEPGPDPEPETQPEPVPDPEPEPAADPEPDPAADKPARRTRKTPA